MKELTCCPREKWLFDLQQAIIQWQEEGKYIVLLVDMNEDVISEDLLQFCKDIDLVEAISLLHGCSPIPTHQHSCHAIDSIYISQALLHNTFGESYLLEQSKQSLGHVAGHSSPPGQNGQKQSSDLASMLPT